MATWFDGVESILEVAWDDSPFTATGSCTWTEETGYLRGTPQVSCRRGRTTELSDFAPGTMSVTFNNLTRRFDASNTSSPLAGKLLPMKQIRWRVVYGGTTAYLFTGLILGFPITYPGMTDSTVTVNCVDRTRLLEQAALPGSAYAAEVLADSPTGYWPMQDEDVTVLTDAVGFRDLPIRTSAGVPTRVEASAPIGQTDAWYTPTVSASNTYSGWSTPLAQTATIPAAIEMWYTAGANAFVRSVALVAVATDDVIVVGPGHGTGRTILIGYSHGGNQNSGGASVEFTIPNFEVGRSYHVAVTVSATIISVYVDGVLIGTDTLVAGSRVITDATRSVYVGMADASAISHVALYATAPSADRIKAHYLAGELAFGAGYGERTGTRVDRILDAIGWPAADVDLSTGETFCGTWLPDSGSALSALRELEDAEQGLCFISGRGYLVFRDRQWQMTNTRSVNAQVVFDDDGTDVKYAAVSVDGNHIDHIRNQVTVTYPGGSVTVKDQTSITAYGPQSDSVNANPLPVGASFLARQLANFRLRIRKDPATRVPAIEIKPRADMATSFAVATLEIGDRVQVIRRPNGAPDPISKFCQVQGIEHQMSADDWTIRLYLAPAPKSYTEAPYLIAGGSSSASYVGVASGNLVPY